MNIPFFLLLIPYAIGLLIFFIWVLFNVWHMKRFALFDTTGKLNTAMFVVISLLIIATTILLLKDIPWFETTQFDASWLNLDLSTSSSRQVNF